MATTQDGPNDSRPMLDHEELANGKHRISDPDQEDAWIQCGVAVDASEQN